jgi:Flp pilus assembly protein TadG
MKTKGRRGASAVEFAIVLPLLILLLFGIVEFGLLLYDKAVLTNASREGARAGVVRQNPRPTDAQIRTVVRQYCDGKLITFGGDTVTDGDIAIARYTNANGEDVLQVSVSYRYDFLLLPNFIGQGFPGLVNLQASTVMRLE